jgi:adenylosuccinate lyase
VKQEGLDNNLMELIAKDPVFGMDSKALNDVLDPSKYTGRSPEITEEFLTWEVEPVLAKNADWKTLDQEDLRV